MFTFCFSFWFKMSSLHPDLYNLKDNVFSWRIAKVHQCNRLTSIDKDVSNRESNLTDFPHMQRCPYQYIDITWFTSIFVITKLTWCLTVFLYQTYLNSQMPIAEWWLKNWISAYYPEHVPDLGKLCKYFPFSMDSESFKIDVSIYILIKNKIERS